MTDDELKALVASLAVNAEQRSLEADKRKSEIDKQLKDLGKQIGGLGEKFGSFTEGLALPSMQRILVERFGMEVIAPSVRVRNGARGQVFHCNINIYLHRPSSIIVRP